MNRPAVSTFFLATLATLLAAATTLYAALWLYNNRSQPQVELGFDNQHLGDARCELVRSVQPGSPAARAGLRPGDRIIAINGRPIENAFTITDIWAKHRPGDVVKLTIERAHSASPLTVRGVFRATQSSSNEAGVAVNLGRDIANTYSLGFLVVGMTVLFLRLKDPNAWLLALMFAGFVAIPGPWNSFAGLNPPLRLFATVYRGLFNNMVTPLFYFFFAVFPTRSPLDRRLPWLKWVFLSIGALLALPAIFGTLGRLLGVPRLFVLYFIYALIPLGLVSLIGNAVSAKTPEARRKIRVILWGTLAGVVPATITLGVGDFFGLREPLFLDAVIVILLWLFPLSFAYAVVKHRVLEIPVLLRRSARYLLVQRGFTILLSLFSIGVTLIFALSFSRYLETLTGAAIPGGIALGTVFGSGLLWTGTRVHRRVGARIDQAFFRSAYDARTILEDLAEKTRTATDRGGLATLLNRHLNEALQPSSLAVYLESHENQLSAAAGNVPVELEIISAGTMLGELRRLGRMDRHARIAPVWDVSTESSNGMPRAVLLAPLRPDCLVPILGRDSRLAGLLVLGARLSEEPYSRDDRQLLTSVANQAGIALESIRLGEKIAEQIEAERRIAQEMEYAKQVQLRLFPQKTPPMETLEYTGGCIQARQVGGDYYDFLELRPGRLALVLADVAGKGISGALLMANLQANLRSQYAAALEDLPGLLQSVNRLFFENSNESSYATLFFADYDDSRRRLRYVNCGHLPPLVLRTDGCVERLTSTATVLGLFERWECSVAELMLAAGDVLVLYTDGVTEAENAAGEQFGESRLIETIRSQGRRSVSCLLKEVVNTVQKFGDGEQADDITMVVARCS
ncbi:MAG: SpoIIE family protein phosphatase [Acidobacteriaceae bacterium]|nr:SpoIIE family protein phosphatase [Acidobacteriaceae bacterium]